MPSKTEAQRRLMAMALQHKRGKLPAKYQSDKVIELADKMSLKQLEDYAKKNGDEDLKESDNERHEEIVKKITDKVIERLKKI